MKKVRGTILLTVLLFVLAVAVQAAPLAYDVSWWTVDSGGGDSRGGSYELSATIGQADAGTLQGGSYSLAGGFWSVAPSAPIDIKHRIMLPLVQNRSLSLSAMKMDHFRSTSAHIGSPSVVSAIQPFRSVLSSV